jgi:hypothetical protein
MSPVPHDAWTLFSPRHAPLAREVIPVKRFRVEFTSWPEWESFQNVTLGDEWFLSTGSVGWLGKVVFEVQVGPDADEKNSFPILRDAEISGV